MKKFVFLAIALMLIAAPAFAGTWVHPTTTLTAIAAGAPLSLVLNPGTADLKDGAGKVVVDPETGKAVQQTTWKNFMAWGSSATTIATYQWATLVKVHPPRKSACDVEWCPDPVQQNGPEGINLSWPLVYEVDGTTWTLTVAYWTNKPVRTNAADTSMAPSRYHTEVWSWKVVRNTWGDMTEAVGLFRKMAVGKCELSMISSASIADKIAWYIDGNAAPVAPLAPILGIKALITGGFHTEARARFGALESYVASLCGTGCATSVGECCKEPAASVVEIVNTCDAPVVNTLVNIIWAIQKANGYTD